MLETISGPWSLFEGLFYESVEGGLVTWSSPHSKSVQLHVPRNLSDAASSVGPRGQEEMTVVSATHSASWPWTRRLDDCRQRVSGPVTTKSVMSTLPASLSTCQAAHNYRFVSYTHGMGHFLPVSITPVRATESAGQITRQPREYNQSIRTRRHFNFSLASHRIASPLVPAFGLAFLPASASSILIFPSIPTALLPTPNLRFCGFVKSCEPIGFNLADTRHSLPPCHLTASFPSVP
ncbi:unnamed protein product, partial [Protopolystoma xenopodis]